MAIMIPQEKQRQKILIYLLIFMIVGALASYYFIFKEEVIEFKMPVTRPKEVKIDFEFLESEQLKNLEPFERVTLPEGGVGRDNPLVPY